MKKLLNVFIVVLLVIIVIILFFILRGKEDNDNDSVIFNLKGDSNIYLLVNGKYNELGVEAYYKEQDYSDKIAINSNLDTNTEGIYIIKYTMSEINNTLERKVYVSNFDEYFNIEYNHEPSAAINLNIKIDSNKISKYLLPNNETMTTNSIYQITSNGTYTFTIYDKYNNSIEKTIEIDNINSSISPVTPTPDIDQPTPLPITPEPTPYTDYPTPAPTSYIDQPTPLPTPLPTPAPTPVESNKLEIHFIASGYYDDAILIKSNKATIFMDGGRGKVMVMDYLKKMNLKTIDYVIGSHTEFDHIDAQGEVIKYFDVKHALYPNSITSCACACTSDDVRSVNEALRSKNMTPEVQSVPSKLEIGDMTLYFIAPYSIGCNKNNNSFIFILQFGNNKFMFTGDADSDFSNQAQMENNAKSLGLSGIEVDVVKYPHHGNALLGNKFYTATKVKSIIVPNYGANQHPNQTVLNDIKSKGIKVYRQSESTTGNIVITSDGKNIEFIMNTEPKWYTK